MDVAGGKGLKWPLGAGVLHNGGWSTNQVANVSSGNFLRSKDAAVLKAWPYRTVCNADTG